MLLFILYCELVKHAAGSISTMFEYILSPCIVELKLLLLQENSSHDWDS